MPPGTSDSTCELARIRDPSGHFKQSIQGKEGVKAPVKLICNMLSNLDQISEVSAVSILVLAGADSLMESFLHLNSSIDELHMIHSIFLVGLLWYWTSRSRTGAVLPSLIALKIAENI